MCYTINPDLFLANYIAKKRGSRRVSYREIYEASSYVQEQMNGRVFINLCADKLYEFQAEHPTHIKLGERNIEIIRRTSFELVKNTCSVNWRLPEEIKDDYLNCIARFKFSEDEL